MKLLTPAQLAEMIGKSEDTVYRWLKAGIIPAAIRESGTIRFDSKEVLAALAKRAVKRAKVPTY